MPIPIFNEGGKRWNFSLPHLKRSKATFIWRRKKNTYVRLSLAIWSHFLLFRGSSESINILELLACSYSLTCVLFSSHSSLVCLCSCWEMMMLWKKKRMLEINKRRVSFLRLVSFSEDWFPLLFLVPLCQWCNFVPTFLFSRMNFLF